MLLDYVRVTEIFNKIYCCIENIHQVTVKFNDNNQLSSVEMLTANMIMK